MLEELRRLRDNGYPQAFLNHYLEYRQEYLAIPIAERENIDFDYFIRCKIIEFLRQ